MIKGINFKLKGFFSYSLVCLLVFLSISSCLLHLLICVSNSSFPLGPSQLYSTTRFQSFYITTEYHPNVVGDTKAMRSKVL